jgi:indole-3-glycerol phosphate synthase
MPKWRSGAIRADRSDVFKGHLVDLKAVRAVNPLPILRKDFVIDAFQITEARGWQERTPSC